MPNKKRVFITGATSELMKGILALVDRNEFELIGLTRKVTADCSPNLTWIEGDIGRPESYAATASRSDIIIHASAITHSRDEELYHTVNCTGTQNLISTVGNNRPLFVLLSSRVAGERSGAYGLSKLMAERMVKKLLPNWLIIRPSEIFGGRKSEGIDKAIRSALKGGIQTCPIGMKSPMYPIHVDDAARIIYSAIFVEQKLGRTVHVNGKEAFTYEDLIRLVSKISGTMAIILPLPKWVLKTASYLSYILPWNPGFVPDQIDRLYSWKESSVPEYDLLSVRDYVRRINANGKELPVR